MFQKLCCLAFAAVLVVATGCGGSSSAPSGASAPNNPGARVQNMPKVHKGGPGSDKLLR